MYKYIPGTPMTSIFEGQPTKTKPKLQSKQGSPFGFWVHTYVHDCLYTNNIPWKLSIQTPMARWQLLLVLPWPQSEVQETWQDRWIWKGMKKELVVFREILTSKIRLKEICIYIYMYMYIYIYENLKGTNPQKSFGVNEVQHFNVFLSH